MSLPSFAPGFGASVGDRRRRLFVGHHYLEILFQRVTIRLLYGGHDGLHFRNGLPGGEKVDRGAGLLLRLVVLQNFSVRLQFLELGDGDAAIQYGRFNILLEFVLGGIRGIVLRACKSHGQLRRKNEGERKNTQDFVSYFLLPIKKLRCRRLRTAATVVI